MNDAGIVRNRAKIEGAIASAKSYLEDHGRRARASRNSCGTSSTAGRRSTLQDHRERAGLDAASIKISKELAARGFKFVGPTIVYAFMQATGMVNDHLVTCFCHETCGQQPRAPRLKAK